MQEAEDLIGPRHVANVRVPPGVAQAVTEAGDDEGGHQRRVGRVLGDDDVGDDVARGGDDGDAALAELQVDVVVEGGREDVADKGGEEDEGDDDVGEAVVGFELVKDISQRETGDITVSLDGRKRT